MLDPDMKVFQRVLQDTPAGKRFRLAWRESRELATHLLAWKDGSESDRRQIQMMYIQLCEQASTCLDVLNTAYSWPEAFPSAKGFIYQPPARVRRQFPTKP